MNPKRKDNKFIVIQKGAREYYAIPRCLKKTENLSCLITDLWFPYKIPHFNILFIKKILLRFHPDLKEAKIYSPSLIWYLKNFIRNFYSQSSWENIITTNNNFENYTVNLINKISKEINENTIVFSYSYTAFKAFKKCKEIGARTILGQIDPGPEEEKLVMQEHKNFPYLKSNWEKAPKGYWQKWEKEIELADRILVNSKWSKDCLSKYGILPNKIVEVPLIFKPVTFFKNKKGGIKLNKKKFNILFLGKICLRKGIARLLIAMSFLKNKDILLTLVGPTEIDPEAWYSDSNIRWVGPVPSSEIPSFFLSSDAFILPTISDGFALTQIESLAYNCPIIVSKNCGNIVENKVNGLLLNDLEPLTIANTILEAKDTFHLYKRPLNFKTNSLNKISKELNSIFNSKDNLS